MKKIGLLLVWVLLLSGCGGGATDPKNKVLLNVSYDPTRELYREYNEAFAGYWRGKTGEEITVRMSNGGSGKQARSVIDGLEADVVTLALAYDIDSIADKGKLTQQNWQARLPGHSSPYVSTIVFLVRKGNPKRIKDWNDLAEPGVSVITPNPKTSGGARWNFLAAWGYALKKYKNDDRAREFVKSIYKNVPVLDSGARGSTTTFVERGIGDVLISWENEAYLTLNDLGKGQFEIVNPSVSILAEPPVALVDKNVEKHGTHQVAQAYLEYLYSPQGQAIVERHYFRPRSKLSGGSVNFPKIELFTVGKIFGGWKKAQAAYFSDGGVFDQIYQPGK